MANDTNNLPAVPYYTPVEFIPGAPVIASLKIFFTEFFGGALGSFESYLVLQGLSTLSVRLDKKVQTVRKVVEFLESRDEIESITYPALKGDKNYELCQKYLGGKSCGVISFVIKGGRNTAMKFMDSLKLACNEVHVADIRTCVLHPASETHRQLTDEQLVAAGINGGMIRFSVGLENVDDIIDDIKGAFEALK